MNAVDIVIIVILLIFVIVGICRGFMFSVLSLFGGIVQLFLSVLLTKPISALLSKIGLNSALQGAYATRMASMDGFTTNLANMDATTLKNHISSSLNSSSLPGIAKTPTKWFLTITPEKIAGKENITLSDILSNAYANFWSILIAFVISFIIIALTLAILSKLAKKAKEIKPLNATDRVLGIVFGIIQGSLVICLILGVLSLFSEGGALKPVYNYIYASKIGSWALTNVKFIMDKYINLSNLFK